MSGSPLYAISVGHKEIILVVSIVELLHLKDLIRLTFRSHDNHTVHLGRVQPFY